MSRLGQLVLACAFGITNNEGTAGYTGALGWWWIDGKLPVVFATTPKATGTTTPTGSFALTTTTTSWTANFTPTSRSPHWPPPGTRTQFPRPDLDPDGRPAITSNPASQSVVSSTPVTFSVTATRSSAAAYYWLVNGSLDPARPHHYSVPSASVSGTIKSSSQLVWRGEQHGGESHRHSARLLPASSRRHRAGFTNAFMIRSRFRHASGTTPLSYQWWQVTGSGATQVNNGGDYSGAGRDPDHQRLLHADAATTMWWSATARGRRPIWSPR